MVATGQEIVRGKKNSSRSDTLLAEGVIIPAAQETEEFISTIFLRPKKMARTVPFLILKRLTSL